MSERKVLNKYYPPDFDPNNIPRCKVARNRTFGVRLMAPCNMKCNTCGEYIAKAKKFNARKEDVDDERYLGLRIYRFYIKCPMCISEIVFKTDPEHTDYIIEAGATRNFQAQILAQRQAQAEADLEEEETKNNPMKMLENRTKQSRHEMDMIEKLEELQELNQRQADVNYNQILQEYAGVTEDERRRREELEDEELVRSVFGGGADGVKRLHDSDSDSETRDTVADSAVTVAGSRVTSSLLNPSLSDRKTVQASSEKQPWERSIGSFSSGSKKSSGLLGIVRPRKQIKSSLSGGGSGTPAILSRTDATTTLSRSSETHKNGSNAICQRSGDQSKCATTVTSSTNITPSAPSNGESVNCAQSSGVSGGGSSASSGAVQSGLSLLGQYSDSDSSDS